jgi:hypothetical protein
VQNAGSMELAGIVGLIYSGPTSLNILPSAITVGYDDHCSDVGSLGCDFDPIPSLQQASVSLQFECQMSAGAETGTNTVYWIRAPGKEVGDRLIVFHHFDFGKWKTTLLIARPDYASVRCPAGQ